MEFLLLLAGSTAAVLAVLLAAWFLSGQRHPLSSLRGGGGAHPSDLLEAATFAAFPDVARCWATASGGMFDRVEYTVIVDPVPVGAFRNSHGFRTRHRMWTKLIRAMAEADALPDVKVELAVMSQHRGGARREIRANIVDFLLKQYPDVVDPDLDLAQEVMET